MRRRSGESDQLGDDALVLFPPNRSRRSKKSKRGSRDKKQFFKKNPFKRPGSSALVIVIFFDPSTKNIEAETHLDITKLGTPKEKIGFITGSFDELKGDKNLNDTALREILDEVGISPEIGTLIKIGTINESPSYFLDVFAFIVPFNTELMPGHEVYPGTLDRKSPENIRLLIENAQILTRHAKAWRMLMDSKILENLEDLVK